MTDERMTNYGTISREVLGILAKNMLAIVPEMTPNPDRQWWQIWKPKMIEVVRFFPASEAPMLKIRRPAEWLK